MIKTQSISKDYQLLVSDIESYFASSDIILQDDRNTIKEIEFNGQKLVVKSYTVSITVRRFVYTYLALILAEYVNLAKIDGDYFIGLGLKYSQQLKKRKTRKKKIKQLLGLC